MLQIRGPKETFPVLKASDVISMYRLVIVLSGEVMLTELFTVIRYIFSGGFQAGPQSIVLSFGNAEMMTFNTIIRNTSSHHISNEISKLKNYYIILV